MIELFIIVAALALAAKPLGVYIALVYNGRRTLLSKVLQPVEAGTYQLLGVNPDEEMTWTRYAAALLLFSLLCFFSLYGLLLLQHHLPLNPDGMGALSPDLAFNIAVSFITNTNWQSYSGEQTLSYLSQTAGLGVQQFASCACGMAVAVALFRAFTRKNSKTIGNFWADLTRGVVYILLPLSLLLASIYTLQGVPQTFGRALEATILDTSEIRKPLSGILDTTNVRVTKPIQTGPVASLMAIKQLGTNGGGFFGANAAHPFENPTPLTNVLQFISILLLPIAFVYAFGVLSGNRRQIAALYAAIIITIAPLYYISISQEMHNVAGKEVRISAENAAAWGVSATITGNGSANAAYGEFKPLSIMAQLLPMMLGEITFGGVGSGMVSLLMYVLVTVFIGGLMVGRTPEFLGKKLGAFEVKLASLIVVIPATIILVGTSIAVMTEAGRAAVTGHGIHGFTEILYGFTSAGSNNGSGMAGLSANSPFYNTVLGIAMFSGRYFILISSLALAGALAAKNTVPPSAGTLPTNGPLFVCMLLIIIVLVGILNYVPALAMGPFAEHVIGG
jgi:potassium-transporting ATPase potassium-binding subunit